MNDIVNPKLLPKIRKVWHWITDICIIKTGATFLILTFTLSIGGGLQSMTESFVKASTENAWLGTAPEGQTRIYRCTDGTPILRGERNANPCPDSEVALMDIKESAAYSTQRFQEMLLIFYACCLGITLTMTFVFRSNAKQ